MRYLEHTDPTKAEHINADVNRSRLVAIGSNKNDPKSVASMERFKRPPYYMKFIQKGSDKK